MFINPNDNIWFGTGILKTKNEDDIKNIPRSSLLGLVSYDLGDYFKPGSEVGQKIQERVK